MIVFNKSSADVRNIFRVLRNALSSQRDAGGMLSGECYVIWTVRRAVLFPWRLGMSLLNKTALAMPISATLEKTAEYQ